jgi:hypothetical protein
MTIVVPALKFSVNPTLNINYIFYKYRHFFRKIKIFIYIYKKNMDL